MEVLAPERWRYTQVGALDAPPAGIFGGVVVMPSLLFDAYCVLEEVCLLYPPWLVYVDFEVSPSIGPTISQ